MGGRQYAPQDNIAESSNVTPVLSAATGAPMRLIPRSLGRWHVHAMDLTPCPLSL